ncbi:MAG: hypothetical protein AAF183_10345 [Pseudomonadota bacterium]
MFAAPFYARPDEAPRAMIGDTGCDSYANRAMAQQRGAVLVIPHRFNRQVIPARFAKALHQGRAYIERMIGRLKRFKRLAQRCEKPPPPSFGDYIPDKAGSEW